MGGGGHVQDIEHIITLFVVSGLVLQDVEHYISTAVGLVYLILNMQYIPVVSSCGGSVCMVSHMYTVTFCIVVRVLYDSHIHSAY